MHQKRGEHSVDAFHLLLRNAQGDEEQTGVQRGENTSVALAQRREGKRRLESEIDQTGADP